ncbi:MAG: AMP-binding protein, partial [Deltaproteobacteria bacterium]|nr:AMP-binding protein [Deltaproteobacteria bacterium]
MSSRSQLRVGDLIRKNARNHPERVAAWLAGRTLTYRELNEQANQIGWALRELGIGHGDRVVSWADTCLEVLPLFVAAAKIGAVFAPLNARLGAAEALPIVRMARPGILIADSDHLAPAREVGEAVGLAKIGSIGPAEVIANITRFVPGELPARD